MLIDPFTIIAQAVNFLILVGALKYFLYDRVIGAMDKREASIAEAIADAEDSKLRARSDADEYAAHLASIDQERQQSLDGARSEARQYRQELVNQARSEAEGERKRWQRSLRSEQVELGRSLRSKAAHEVVQLSRRAVTDLASADLETLVISRGLEQLDSNGVARETLIGAAEKNAAITVRTSFESTPEQQGGIRQRLLDLGLSDQQKVRFDLDPELVIGIEFRVDGTAISWNATDYFDRMKMNLDEVISTVDPIPNAH